MVMLIIYILVVTSNTVDNWAVYEFVWQAEVLDLNV